MKSTYMVCRYWMFLLGVLGIICGASASVSAAEGSFFADQVLPLLETHCLDCHSEDAGEGDLRLDSPQAALRGGNSGEPLIVPGDSQRSYLLARITTSDSSRRMPPESDPLSDAEIEVLRKWVEDTASWQPFLDSQQTEKSDHWSFQPIHRPPVPSRTGKAEAGKADAGKPIDAFVDSKLDLAHLQRSPRATRRDRIRRLYLVMHGLPPTPEQVDRFLNDSRPDAWAIWVDQVLSSPRYGEHWATRWLDLVRFGETHGFEMNRERPHAWRYRDWVVDALNTDLPYDQFVSQQIAGDSLGADVATGFLVAGPWDQVKGQDKQLLLTQRQDELADMVHTTGTAFLGLTIGCARCHNHKFDPISQTDFYAMQAVFAGVLHRDRPLPLAESARLEIEKLDQQIQDQRARLAVYQEAVKKSPKRPSVTAQKNVESFSAVPAQFVRMTIDATNGGNVCLDELEVFAAEDDRNLALVSNGAKASSGGDFVHPLHNLGHLNDGQYGNAHSWIAAQATASWVQIEFASAQPIDRIVWGRDRQGEYRDRVATEYRFSISLDGKSWTEVASSADRQPFDPAKTTEVEYDFSTLPEDLRVKANKELQVLKNWQTERAKLAQPVLVYAGAFAEPGPTHRLYRGEPTAPREQVAPAPLHSLSDLQLPMDAPEKERRLAIAKWIADRANPLTARVMVNRIWQSHFGTGLVDTPSDFGGNGTLPTHPELLDWLASEFMDQGWSMKQMHRLILNSQTWQQQSRPVEEAMAVDASTRLLWRFPPRRLPAEGIRDSILAVTGKLNLQSGGPGFSPFQIENENVRHYFPKQEFGPDDWRRMIYMTKVRQEQEAVFGVFDCPDFNQVVSARNRSTTPLQALNLLNSRFVLQQADLFVERLEQQTSTPEERVSLAYQLCFGRSPEPDESEAALAFSKEYGWPAFARAILNANEFVFIP
ncbi:Planctomycete cytochrome C [Roseimaritima multifibrata]|uniref:Planctomycete cytochrome C n=1 Tax=Roseimaritima multifibrata TaxID=1930274 RepID=A0A517M9C3_9BACT|nr:DUF1553 domain-containing protein [Roseimaritima multifibrata]QDS91485.1 Planctomycete cytochrome C [Roseimaritima multifibrata]